MRGARILGLTVAALATATLTGCEKPPPAISVWSNATSVNQQALCWAFDSDRLEAGQCAQDIVEGSRSEGVPTITTAAGNTVGISVDTAVAEAGWTPVIGGQPLTTTPLTTTYFRFTVPLGFPEGGLPLQVVAGQDTLTRGVWIVKVVSTG